MRLQLPQVRTKYKVSQDTIIQGRENAGIALYIFRDLYGIKEYSSYGNKSGNPIIDNTYVSKYGSPNLDNLFNAIGQIPPYVKKDNDGFYIEELIPKGFQFSFQKIKWTINHADNIMLNFTPKANKGLNTSFALLFQYIPYRSLVFDKAGKLEFTPEQFGLLEFEQV